VILTSGYNNSDGNGYFFIVNAATGALIQKIATNATGYSATNQSGLAHAKAYVNDYTNYTADAVYAGDLLGNLWRVDLTTASGNYSSPTLIAQLTDPSSVAQPITTMPFPEQQPNTLNRYVMVGTGRLLAPSDISSTQIQTFYSILDGKTTVGGFFTSASGSLPTGISFPVTRSVLVDNTNLLTGITPTTAKPMGWYYDLSTDSTTGIAERIIVDPATYFGIVGFAADLPSGTTCNPTGSNRIFATSYTTGVSVLTSPTDSATQIAWSTAVNGMVTQLQFDNINGTVYLDAGSNTGGRVSVQGSWVANGNFHRINWREVPTAD
jgi:type IV pilus assembly protein PilY1